MMTGTNMLHIAYRGTAPALTDLLGGQVQVMFASMPGSIEYIRAGCKIAINTDPLRVDIASNSDPSRGLLSASFPLACWAGKGLGDDWRGPDWPDTARLF